MSDRRNAYDRRAFWRSSVPAGARFHARVARLGGPESYCEVVNIGAGGIMIRARPVFFEGDCVWVRLIGRGSPWTLLGEVRRAHVRRDESLVAIVFDTPLAGKAGIPEVVRDARRAGNRGPM